MKKKINYSEKNETELTKTLKEQRESLRGLRFSAAGSRPKDSTAPAKARREIARVLTELGSRAKKA